ILTTQGNITVDHPKITVYPVMRHWSWPELLRLARCIRRCSPDALLLLYSSGPHYNYHPMITFVPTISKTLLPGTRFVTLFENVFSPNWTSILERALLKGLSPWVGAFGTLLSDSDRLIVMSDHQRVFLSKYSPAVERKSVLIPPPPI